MSLPFEYNVQYFGGTEYMARYFHKNILPYKNNFYNYQSFILPGSLPDFKTMIEDTRDVILWMHNTFSQFDPNVLFCVKDNRFLQKIKYIVVVSDWHKQIIKSETKIADNKIIIIPNSFDPIIKNKNKFNKIDKVKIIHTSSPERGLEILCKSLNYVEEDFELNIFSDIFPEVLEDNNLFKQTEKDKRVMFFGKTPRKTVRKYFSDSHIWAYPSVFLETFCISLAEAISAECLPIYPNLGALKETANNFGVCYDYIEDSEIHAKKFAKILTDAIIQIKNKTFNPINQATIIEEKYSWSNFEKNWESFHDLL